MSYERPGIRRMQGYVPGEQPASAGACKLNTNENPYPPSPAVQEALASFDATALRTYPHPTADALRCALAEHHGLTRDHVLATNGGDEALRLAATAFAGPGAPLGLVRPSYSLYPVLAGICGAPLATADLTDDWAPPEDFAQRMNAAGARLICLANPHAPSGRLLDAPHLGRLAWDLDGVLLLDEAYADFADPALGYDAPRLIADCGNLLVLRSFSKGYGLAGLRLGYLLGQPGLIDPLLRKVRDSYNVGALGQHLGLAGLRDRAYAEGTWQRVREARRRLREDLAGLGLPAPPSQANFLLASVPDDARLSARALCSALKERGILVRHFDEPRLRDKLRISVGAPEQNAQLIAALGTLLGPDEACHGPNEPNAAGRLAAIQGT